MSHVNPFEEQPERTPEQNQKVADTGEALSLLAEEGDFDFLSKLVPMGVHLMTHALHEKYPHDDDEDCPHLHLMRAAWSYQFASALAHYLVGPGELLALIRALATALAMTPEISGIPGPTLTPVQILDEAKQGFNQRGWEELKVSLVEEVLGGRDRIQDQVQQILNGVGGENGVEVLSPDDLLDMLNQLKDLPEFDPNTDDGGI